jgi:predicted permease
MASSPAALTGVLHDIRYGIRQMRRAPALAAIVVLSLALGIGANTAIFSVVNAMALRDLPVTDPARLMVLQYLEPKGDAPAALEHSHSGRGSQDSEGRTVGMSVSWPMFSYLRERTRTMAPLVGFVPLGMADTLAAVVNGESMFVAGDMVTADFFTAVGVAASRGRVIGPDDERPDAPRVAVISDRFWERAFARNPEAIGHTMTLNSVPITVVGVLPASFIGLETGRSPDLWLQMGPQPGLVPWGGSWDAAPQAVFASPGYWWLQVVGRVKPGVTIDHARAEIGRLFRESVVANISSTPPADKLPIGLLTPASKGLQSMGVSRRYMTSLSVLMAAGGLVFLIACANVATLLLARATARRKEMSLRLAMGAARSRLARQLLTESAVYAAAGAGLGLLFATWGGPTLLVLLTQGRDPLPVDVRLDHQVLAFTAAVSLLTTLLCGLAPAFRATRLDVAEDLKENAATARGEVGAGRLRGGTLLVAAQVAMSLPLVLGAGLFVRTLLNLQHQPLGFNPEQILTFTVDPSSAGMKGASLLAAHAHIQDRLRAMPGVRGVTMSRMGLITGWVSNSPVSIDGDTPATDPQTRRIHWNQVGPDFFETLGMSLLVGRDIDGRDTATGPPVAVVNEVMAKQLFPGQYPVGKRFLLGRGRFSVSMEIVGVVRDAKYASLRAPAPPTAYLPYTQGRAPLSRMWYEVRAEGDPMALVSGIRRAVSDMVPGAPIGDVKTQARLIDDSLGQETMYVRLFAFFGLLALLLACVGLYGTMSYALGRRTREIGIRMALGAAQARVLGSALAEALVIAVAGVSAGGFLAWAGARYVRSLLFEVTPLDLPTITAAVVIMLTVAVGAAFLPARRASRLEPLKALREE